MDCIEKTIAGLTVRIDRTLCVGFGDCIERAPDVFELDGEGLCTFKEPAGPVDRDRLLAACDACPVDALAVLDETGRTIVPG